LSRKERLSSSSASSGLPDSSEINPTPNDNLRVLVKFMNYPPAGTEDGLGSQINQEKMKSQQKRGLF
jgi:hypothetical protein